VHQRLAQVDRPARAEVIAMECHELAAADPAVVTAADMVTGHVVLDVSCSDRLYLNGYVNKLQTPGGVVYFFHDHRRKPTVSPALFEPIGEKFRRDIRDWAQANGIPLIRFNCEDRKAEAMAKIPLPLDDADRDGGY